jgi:hypothetical protein
MKAKLRRKNNIEGNRGAKPIRAYTVLTAILYGQFEWLDRLNDGSVIIPTAKMRAHLKMAPGTYRHNISWLSTIGLITELEWHGHYCRVKAAVPIGLCRHIPSSLELEAEIDVKYITDTPCLIDKTGG